jgi:tRNA/tmRNA/rRNA uracil-C5-methylase (TrmA/RlmC/RlmD family)
MPVFVGAELVLEIKDWAPPQGALGFWGDVAIFVPYVIPGELVKVQVTQRKKNMGSCRYWRWCKLDKLIKTRFPGCKSFS